MGNFAEPRQSRQIAELCRPTGQMDASRCCKHRSGKKLRTVQSEDRDSFQPTLNSHGGKLSDRERKTSRAEPWTRAHKLQVTAIAIAVVLGVTGLVFTLSVNAFKDQSAATTTSQESTVNESSAEASPPNDGCKQSVDLDKPAGWGPARLLTPADDFVEWPALTSIHRWADSVFVRCVVRDCSGCGRG